MRLDAIHAVTIFEFAPAADEIWGLEPSPKTGYVRRDPVHGTITFLDIPRHDAKMRPRVKALYAGGKATNVARVFDRLLAWPRDATPALRDDLRVTLATFLAESQRRDDATPALAPGAVFVQTLQRREMHRITLAYETFPPREGLLADRRCIHLFDEREQTDLLNFSPRLHWSDAEQAVVLEHLRRSPPAGLVVLAGSAPLGVETLYREIIATLRAAAPGVRIAVDIDVPSLHRCLSEGAPPDLVSMNRNEYNAVEAALWTGFEGILHVHDHSGAYVWHGDGARLRAGDAGLFHTATTPLTTRFGPASGPTIGAGDAAHAGLLFGLLAGLDLHAATRLGQAIAADAVRNAEGTRGLDPERIRTYFAALDA
jgi:fructose-1-phosphate kinase PfkB-like protein